MSDSSEKDDSADGPLAGARLAIARRDQDMSLGQIAKELHLDEAKVQALEQNQFAALGAPVFAKGHLRKYAELVGVPIDDILTDYYQLNRAAGAPPVVGPAKKRGGDFDLGRYILPALAALLVVGGLGWWFSAGSPLPAFGGDGPASRAAGAAGETVIELPSDSELPESPSQSADELADELADESAGEVASPEAEDAVPEATAETAAEATTNGVPEQAAASQAAAAAPPAAEPVALTLRFTGDCWTEVTDASGSRLFFDLGRADTVARVSGAAPLRILLGSSANVAVEVDGQPYSIPASALRGDTARFTVDPL